jgi:hypothetical protein
MAVVFAIPNLAELTAWVLKLVEPSGEVAAAAFDVPAAFSPEVSKAIDHNLPEPTAKGTGLAIVAKRGQFINQDQQHILNQIVDVGFLNFVPPDPGTQERRIEFDQAIPGVALGFVSQLIEQESEVGKGSWSFIRRF